ncbi:MAG: flagellar basal-body rod protein FlgF [Desulfobacterales bacterium]|nr:MAG: flagellar basal-body rod protein FlgF [Desulfobacterales bacterium]
MSGDIYLAAAGALACEKRLQIISNNLANANTVGFKMDQGYFKLFDTDDPTSQVVPNATNLESQAHLFWTNFNVYTDHSSGPLKKTGNDFDLALEGDGFFCVQTPDGVHYTRKGDFTLNAEGVLVTRNGWPVLGEGGEITVRSDENPNQYAKFAVDEQGNVSVDGRQVDTLRIVNIAELNRLTKAGDTLFKPPAAGTGEGKAENFRVSQGFIELSNVDAVKMLTEMIEVLRGYESYQKVIQAADDANSKAINQVGTL